MTNHSSLSANRDLPARLVRILDVTLGLVLSLLVFAMMLLTFVDVVGRQAFNAPVPAGFEITEIAMGMAVYLGLPLVCARREHITISLIAHLITGRARRVQHVVLNLLLGFVTLVWAREVWIQAGALAEQKVVMMFLKISTAPFLYAMSVLTFFAAATFLVLAWCYLRGWEPPPSVEEI